MALPLRKPPEELFPDPAEDSETETDGSALLRWVERPGGRMELVELPLTPELFLDPQLEDKMVQGKWHEETGREIMNLLEAYFRPQPDVLVTHDMKHLFGPGLPGPAPDASVIRGIVDRDADRESFDAVKEGLVPCLVVEVVSPRNARVRRTDEVDKVRLYERVGIAEYVIVDSQRRPRGRTYFLLGYRLDRDGRYQRIEPDAEGRLISQSTGIAFQMSPDGRRVLLFDSASGRRLLSPAEWEALAAREAEARANAEAEMARLREELERLRGR